MTTQDAHDEDQQQIIRLCREVVQYLELLFNEYVFDMGYDSQGIRRADSELWAAPNEDVRQFHGEREREIRVLCKQALQLQPNSLWPFLALYALTLVNKFQGRAIPDTEAHIKQEILRIAPDKADQYMARVEFHFGRFRSFKSELQHRYRKLQASDHLKLVIRSVITGGS
ncbi:MAG: hypothetical protein ABIH67_00160 [Candidatus Uhrbacteria bacterium]